MRQSLDLLHCTVALHSHSQQKSKKHRRHHSDDSDRERKHKKSSKAGYPCFVVRVPHVAQSKKHRHASDSDSSSSDDDDNKVGLVWPAQYQPTIAQNEKSGDASQAQVARALIQ